MQVSNIIVTFVDDKNKLSENGNSRNSERILEGERIYSMTSLRRRKSGLTGQY